MATVAHLFRHPFKALGLEEMASASLTENQTFPGDRLWAVAHEASKAENGQWARHYNFIRGGSSPGLMAVRATLDDATGHVTFSHPDRPDLTVDPDTQGDDIVNWVKPICDPNRAQPTHVIKAGDRGLTDSSSPGISILSLRSLRVLAQKAGFDPDPRRFRANIWLEGLDPWEEFEWVGKTLTIGGASLEITKRIDRCPAITVDPVTGRQDVDTLRILEDTWDHTDFGVQGIVTSAGTVRTGDPVTVP